MAKPNVHAESSARRFGGRPEDYLDLHLLMDSYKTAMADQRGRAVTHTTFFVHTILPRVYGETIRNSDGKDVSVRSLGEQHCLEDFGGRFIPTLQDYLEGVPHRGWMNNGAGMPPSAKALDEARRERRRDVFTRD